MDSLGGTREAPGRQERSNWTACEAPGRHQGGRKGPFWTACEAPGRQERTNWIAWEAPGGTREAGNDHLDSLGGTKHQGSRKGLIGQPARHQGGPREAGTLMFLACGFRFCV